MKGDPSLFENDRPISLLPAISKVLEEIIALKLTSYFQKNIFCLTINMALGQSCVRNIPLWN